MLERVGLWLQEWRMHTYEPVPALVAESDVVNHSAKGDAWEPVVLYHYPVENPVYSATRVTPIRTFGSHEWAAGLAMRYQPGQVVKAYRHPQRRASAFLVPERQFNLVGWCLVPLMILIAGAYGLRRMG